jgi:hypothetical protein
MSTIKYNVGDKVMCNGYPGTVSAVAVTPAGMMEVKLERGGVCVDPSDELTVRHAATEHACRSALTVDGSGAYCVTCGETLA